MKQAKIECPHCAGSITVRVRDDQPTVEEVDAVFSAADNMFKALDTNFRRIFDQPFWRRGRL